MIEKYLGIAFILILIFLILNNRSGFDSAIRGIGALNIASIGALQGQPVNAFGVTVGQSSGTSVGNAFGNSFGNFGGAGGFGVFGRQAA